MLTTFNEVNMEPVMTLRARYRDAFERAHNGTRLGFMGFFVRASVEALKRFPLVNACIDGDEIVYHGFYDVGVAVSTERGLVVPVLRDADALSLAQIEEQIAGFGARARGQQAHHRRDVRRNVFDLQRRGFRLVAVHPHPESAANRHPRHAQDRTAAGGGRR